MSEIMVPRQHDKIRDIHFIAYKRQLGYADRSNQLFRVEADQHAYANGDGHATVRQDNRHNDAFSQSTVVSTSLVTLNRRTEIVVNNHSKMKFTK